MTSSPAAAHLEGVNTVRWEPATKAALDAAAPVVLVHGLGGSTLNWHVVGQPLADRLGAVVHAIDLVGFGRTPIDGRRATVVTNASVLASYLRETGPATVIGSSMGGSIAVRVAAREPELVERLVLVNAALPFARGRPSPRQVRNLAVFATASLPMAGPWIIETRARRLGAERVVDASLRASCSDPASIDPMVRDAFVELTVWRHEQGIASRAYHDAIRSLLTYLATGMATDLAAVRAPGFIVHGRHDQLVPIVLADTAARVKPSWRYEVLDCGHLPALEQPELLVDLVTAWIAQPA